MVNKFLRKKSKRMPCRTKYKIERKVREHNKKLRRDKKKHPERFPKKSDPGVPNSLPFKDKIVAEAQEAKQRLDEQRMKRREEIAVKRRELRDSLLNKKRNIGGTAASLLRDAEKKQAEYDQRHGPSGDKNALTDRSAKAYYKEFKKVVEAADVILEVLDARDPMGTRCTQVEEAIMAQPNKKLVLVLNKADLVPRDNLEKWLKCLRGEYPCIVFKASTQTQGSRLSQTSGGVFKSSDDLVHSSRCVGGDVLMSLLKNYCRNKGIKTSIAVGVVGLPNVGKSSLINSLKRSKSCGVGAVPGFTKSMQEVSLDSKVKLLDCPGLVLPGGDISDASIALRNAFKLEQLDDPIKPVGAILSRANESHLMLHYRLAEWKDTHEFLALLAKRLGKLKKGGIPDVEMAAKAVLHDWNVGRIKYFTNPPEESIEQKGSVTLVNSLAKEFDIDSLLNEEGDAIASLPLVRPSDTMLVVTSGPLQETQEMESEEEEDSDMEEDSDDDESDAVEIENEGMLPTKVSLNLEPVSKETTEPERKARWETEKQIIDISTAPLKKIQKKALKKARKESRRNETRTDDLADAMASFGGINEKEDDAYDFNDF